MRRLKDALRLESCGELTLAHSNRPFQAQLGEESGDLSKPARLGRAACCLPCATSLGLARRRFGCTTPGECNVATLATGEPEEAAILRIEGVCGSITYIDFIWPRLISVPPLLIATGFPNSVNKSSRRCHLVKRLDCWHLLGHGNLDTVRCRRKAQAVVSLEFLWVCVRKLTGQKASKQIGSQSGPETCDEVFFPTLGVGLLDFTPLRLPQSGPETCR